MVAAVKMRDAAGTPRVMTQIRMRDAGNTLRTITRIRMRDAASASRVVWDTAGTSSFAATASPTGVNGSSGTGTIITNSTTVTPTGGTSPYTYAWTVVSHSNETAPTVNSPTAATTAFTQTNMGAGAFEQATFRCTVTDSATPANTTTVDVPMTCHDTSTL